MSRFATAAKIAKDKQAHPENYCAVRGCLWRVNHIDGRVTPCRKHSETFKQPTTEWRNP